MSQRERWAWIMLIVVLCACFVRAQSREFTMGMFVFNGLPSGSCNVWEQAYDANANNFYHCVASAWALVQPPGLITIYHSADGSPVPNAHIVEDLLTVPAGISAPLVVNLLGSAAFTNSTSYSCTANNLTEKSGLTASYQSGNQFSFSLDQLKVADSIRYICVGN